MRTHGFIGTSAANDAVPDNSPGDADYGWVGAAQKLYERTGFARIDGPMGATGHFGCNRFYLREL